MSKYYVSEEDVLQAIDYFKTLDIDDDPMLPAFLIAKHLGISLRRPVKFTRLNTEEKNQILRIIWLLGGLQGKHETGEKRLVLFPNNFNTDEIVRGNFYQPGTKFSGVASRLKDTVEKVNYHDKIFVDNDGLLTLSRNYKEQINEDYLKGNKISLKHFACWVFRFVDFDFPEEPNNKEFTRVVSKAIKRLFKISKSDFLWLFEDDILSNSISVSSNVIDSNAVRNEFNFAAGLEPEITATPPTDTIQEFSVNKEDVRKYIQLTGDNPTDEQIYQTLIQTKQIVLTGVPGIGKSRFLKNLKKKFDYTEMIQFHANYSYEDFIGGETIEGSSIKTEKGKFLSFIEEAKKDTNKDKSFLFVIDELNRGNIAQIFGETILILDRGYSVSLAKEIEGTTEISIPDNVYIACSMNTSDRNIAFIDLAIRRRFAFVELHPNYELLSSITEYRNFDLGNVLKTINTRILNALGKEELLLGHSYFLSDSVIVDDKYVWTDETLHLQFNYVILPTLREYTFSNPNALVTILGEPLSSGLIELDDFIEAFEEEFGTEG